MKKINKSIIIALIVNILALSSCKKTQTIYNDT